MRLLMSDFKYCHHSGLTKQLTVLHTATARRIGHTTISRSSRHCTNTITAPVPQNTRNIFRRHASIRWLQTILRCLQDGLSTQNRIFFQLTLINVPFTANIEFLPPNIDDISSCLQCYAVAMTLILPPGKTMRLSPLSVASAASKNTRSSHLFLSLTLFTTPISYRIDTASTQDNLFFSTLKQNISFDLNHKQTLFLNVTDCMQILLHSDGLLFHFDQHGLPVYLVTGMQGTGKTTAICGALYRFLFLNLNILVVCPTGFLTSANKAEFGDFVTSDYLHASFNLPTNPSQSPSMSWFFVNFHVIFIDEIPTISLRHSDHIFECLHSLLIFPLLNLFGDKFQLELFQSTDNSSMLLPNFFENTFFRGKASHFLLTEQHRCTDQLLNSFLCLIRHFHVTKRGNLQTPFFHILHRSELTSWSSYC